MDTLIEACKANAVQAMESFLVVFSFIPDDKLTWTPAPSAKSAIRIAAHTALYAGRFARMIEARELPRPEGLEEWIARREAEDAALTDRAEVEAVFRKGTDEVLAALDSLTPEEVESTLDSGFGWTMPMTSLMNMPARHAYTHTGQLDFIQTCWDDQEVHF